MLTYNFEDRDCPIYEYVYKCVKNDILSGRLKPGEKLPSKRSFANNNGISTITIQNAYDQLISEGYVYTLPKKGYYVSNIEGMANPAQTPSDVDYDIEIPQKKQYRIDFSGNEFSAENFPFSVWTKISREVMTEKKEELMNVAPVCGVNELREAIARHLRSFRGMMVDPNQIIIGAGTEYLYGLITELLGNDKIYTIENPGYKKLAMIYRQREITCKYAAMDEQGVTAASLENVKTDVAHICPNHHFPTGITMPASRRYEILSWANAREGRYVIEDDYDSEFRTEGKPIPTLFSIDGCEKVIYMNTFSKSLSPTIRISYMVLPVKLVRRFYQNMSFYSCTVSNFEQYTLAEFIMRGYFEKHINRMRLYYIRKRKRIIETIKQSILSDKCEIIENDSGLHFLVKLKTDFPDSKIENELEKRKIRIRALSDYYFEKNEEREHFFIINYSNIKAEEIGPFLETIEKVLSEN